MQCRRRRRAIALLPLIALVGACGGGSADREPNPAARPAPADGAAGSGQVQAGGPDGTMGAGSEASAEAPDGTRDAAAAGRPAPSGAGVARSEPHAESRSAAATAGRTAAAPSPSAPTTSPVSPGVPREPGVSGASAPGSNPPVAPGTPRAPRPPVRLGGVFPLSGPLGSVGQAMMQGIQAILTQANETGGVGGAALELRVEDDQFDPVRGKALVQKLINEDKVFALAGIFSPFTTQAALPDIRSAGVPLVSPSGSDDREFDEPLLYPVTNPCGRQMAGNVQQL